jgi:hypothetical protein
VVTTRLLWLAAATALACGFLVLGVRAASAPANNRAAARADAAALLTRLQLPAGASASTVEPAGDGGQLARPAVGPAATPNVVDRHGWWRVPGGPAAVLAYVAAHPPAGAHRFLSGPGVAGFAWRPRRRVLNQRWLIVHAVALADGSTGVRADAQVVWVTPRPAHERIPAGERRLRVTVGRHSLLVTSRSQIRQVVRLLNALPAAQPGAVNCPADMGIRVRLAFRPRPAVAVVDTTGCGGVTLTLHGRRQPPLAGGRELIPRLARVLHRKTGFFSP